MRYILLLVLAAWSPERWAPHHGNAAPAPKPTPAPTPNPIPPRPPGATEQEQDENGIWFDGNYYYGRDGAGRTFYSVEYKSLLNYLVKVR